MLCLTVTSCSSEIRATQLLPYATLTNPQTTMKEVSEIPIVPVGTCSKFTVLRGR